MACTRTHLCDLRHRAEQGLGPGFLVRGEGQMLLCHGY